MPLGKKGTHPELSEAEEEGEEGGMRWSLRAGWRQSQARLQEVLALQHSVPCTSGRMGPHPVDNGEVSSVL